MPTSDIVKRIVPCEQLQEQIAKTGEALLGALDARVDCRECVHSPNGSCNCVSAIESAQKSYDRLTRGIEKTNQCPSGIERDIGKVRDLMIQLRFYEESRWLGLALASRDACQSAAAKTHLRSAATTAIHCGYSRVAEWLEQTLLVELP